MINANVTEVKIVPTSFGELSSGAYVQEIVRNLNEAIKIAEINLDPEIFYFISMASQCAHEKILLWVYESS